MSEIKEMTIEEIEARSSEIVKEIEANEVTEERLAELDAESVEIEARRAELKKAVAEAQEQRNAVAEQTVAVESIKEVIKEERKMTNKEVCASVEYRDAFKNYIITGRDAECRALLTENVSGDVPVPEMVYDVVKNAWEQDGIVSRIKKAYVKGNLKVGFEISADGAFIHTEGQAVTDDSAEDLELGIVNLVPANIKKFIYISDEVIAMDSGAFVNYVYTELAYQIAKKLADTVIGKIAACGTVSTAGGCGVTALEEASIGLDTVAKALALTSDQVKNPVIIMNKATFASFKAVQAAGNYGYDPFEGLPVLFNNTITAFSTSTTTQAYAYAYVGDLEEGILANFPNGEGITIKYDDLSKAEQDLVKIVGKQYVAVDVVAPYAFTKVVKPATPVVGG